jgi:hypothetical protein
MEKRAQITLYDGMTYLVSLSQRDAIRKAKAQGAMTVVIAGSDVAVSSISHTDEVDWFMEPDAVDLLPASVDIDTIRPRTSRQERWLKLLSLNAHRLQQEGSEGRTSVLMSLEDLDHYEQTGEWPDYVPVTAWTTPQGKSIRAHWVKRHVSERDYSKYYAGSPGYHRLSQDDEGIVIGFTRVVTGKSWPRHLEVCSEKEAKSLEYLAGRN